MDPNTINSGDFILIQRQDYMRLRKIKPNTTINLGNFIIEIDNLIGSKYLEYFKMKLKGGNKNVYTLEKVTAIDDLALNSASGKDNRHIIDDGQSQTLRKEEIEQMRSDSQTSNEIVEKLVEHSKTFASKTEYSQEKYVKKKQKKYFDYITVRRPTIRLLAQTFYKTDPSKILNMRCDDLSQIITYANVHAYGNYILYDSGSSGLLTAAILNAIGPQSDGRLIYIHPGNECQKNALLAMKFPQEQLDRCINVNLYSVLRWFYQQRDQNDSALTTTDDEDGKKRKLALDECVDGRKRPCWHFNNENACRILDGKVQGMIIACKEHPLTIIQELEQFLDASRALVIYHNLKEPLQDVYQALHARTDFIHVRLFNNFMRQYQVLPERTHPLVNMDFGGYILTAYKIKS